MSILIKGMEMPTCCFYCEMCYQDQDSEHCITSRCAAQEHKEIFPDKSVRDDDCPLVEVPKHGRLIDADLLFQHILLTNGNLYANVIKTDFLDIMPTIIEAEYPPSIPFDKMWKDLKKQDPFFVEVEEEVKKLKAEGKL